MGRLIELGKTGNPSEYLALIRRFQEITAEIMPARMLENSEQLGDIDWGDINLLYQDEIDLFNKFYPELDVDWDEIIPEFLPR